MQHRFAWLADALPDTYKRAERARKQFGDDDPRIVPSLAALANRLLRQQKYVPAQALLRECLALCLKKQANKWTTFQAKALLGKALLGQKKYAEAEPLLLQGHEGLKQHEAAMPAQVRLLCLTNAVQYLVELYAGWGSSEKAAPWQKKLEEMKGSKWLK